MFKKPFTTISIATLAVLGAFAMSVEGASAGFSDHGFGVSFHSGHSDHGSWGHDDWGHRRSWGYYGYGAPVYVSTPYARPCYYTRRGGALYKVCPVY